MKTSFLCVCGGGDVCCSYIEMAGKYNIFFRFKFFCGKWIRFQNLPYSMANVEFRIYYIKGFFIETFPRWPKTVFSQHLLKSYKYEMWRFSNKALHRSYVSAQRENWIWRGAPLLRGKGYPHVWGQSTIMKDIWRIFEES